MGGRTKPNLALPGGRPECESQVVFLDQQKLSEIIIACKRPMRPKLVFVFCLSKIYNKINKIKNVKILPLKAELTDSFQVEKSRRVTTKAQGQKQVLTNLGLRVNRSSFSGPSSGTRSRTGKFSYLQSPWQNGLQIHYFQGFLIVTKLRTVCTQFVRFAGGE